jgi:hypothetical protein
VALRRYRRLRQRVLSCKAETSDSAPDFRMDELDRLYRRLVQNIRSGFPELESRPFEVAQIYQQIVPYRTQRRPLGIDSNDQYELAIMQLLSGARGLLVGDRDMVDALAQELDSPNPDLSAYRAYGTSTVALSTDALKSHTFPELTPAGDPFDLPGLLSPVANESVMIAGRATEPFTAPPSLPPGSVLESPRPRSPRPSPLTSATPLEKTPPSVAADSQMAVPRRTPLRVGSAEKCRYCSCALPEGRALVFCPGCGHDLTVQHCPACNTELEMGWKFCISCGRDTR